jgi:lipopolysaccharide/colanic/teichoic acid biosynthesis glycosyltransferase
MNPPNTSLVEQSAATLQAEFAPPVPFATVATVGRRPTLAIDVAPRVGFYERFGKRAIDVVGASVLLLLSAPVLLIAFLAVKLETRGPVLFCSPRCGKDGEKFSFYKIRSMYQGAHRARAKLMHLNEMDGPVFKLASDPRITRVGRILRRTSIDELPQLWNVICGDMSLVGPRPPIPEEVAEYTPFELQRLSVKPGLTCLWQVSGRSTLGFDEWMRLDNEYIDRRTFAVDMQILVRTIPAVLSCHGAY